MKELLVIGGGAAGFFCAVNAARMNPQMRVILVEKSDKLLSKVKVSGGGRCNVTHACFDIVEMSRKYPRGERFVRKAFHHFFTTDIINWFRERGVRLKTETDGRMFPVTDSSQTIINCLLNEADKYGVEIFTKATVNDLLFDGNRFEVNTSRGIFRPDFICIASGGFPKAEMFDWLTQTGHTIAPPVPSLFTFNMPGNPIRELMGITVEKAGVRIAGTKLSQEGPLLITHWGMSGPAVLKLSAWGARELAAVQYHFTVIVNWLPVFNEQQIAEQFRTLRVSSASQRIAGRNPFGLPLRLWDFLLKQADINEQTRWADLPVKSANRLVKLLSSGEFEVKGKTTFKEEFVTAGGINLSEIDPNTMMSRKVSGLYFAGEVMDVDGVTGGFNFQHAWTSGYIAAAAIAKELNEKE